MTHPVNSDKISTNYQPSNTEKADPASGRSSEAATNSDRRSAATDTADLERASARYAQSVNDPSPLANAEQARARIAQLRDAIQNEPQKVLQAHSGITQAKTDAALSPP